MISYLPAQRLFPDAPTPKFFLVVYRYGCGTLRQIVLSLN